MPKYTYNFLVIDNRNAVFNCMDMADSQKELFSSIFRKHGVENVKTISILSVETNEND